MGELVYHDLGSSGNCAPAVSPYLRRESLVFRATARRNPVKRELVLVEEMNPVGRKSGIPLWRRKHSKKPCCSPATFPRRGLHALFFEKPSTA